MASHAAMRLIPSKDDDGMRKISTHRKISAHDRRVERLPILTDPPHLASRRRVKIVRKPNVFQKVLKAFVPHFGLTFLLLLYLGLGSWVFIVIESKSEDEKITAKVNELRQVYKEIVKRSYGTCAAFKGDYSQENEATFKESFQKLLGKVVEVHTRHDQTQLDHDQLREWTIDREPKWRSRWRWSTSILHSLGVLTTTGYSYVQLFTREGQIFAILYGLIGFPLTFITAANIGKFLSEMVTFLHHQYQRKTSGGYSFRTHEGFGSPMKKSSRASSMSDMDNEYFEMPAWAILGMTLFFCCLGGIMYMWFIPEWSFVDALYFAFNAVTNVTLGDVEVRDIWFSIITVLYVIFGLAVVTMSIDLAQNQLRNLFQRVHYVGRKIRRWYGHIRGSQIDDDVKEVLRIITTIRKEYPEKKNVTKTDILQFLNQRVLRYRESGAYSPGGISGLPFADDNVSFSTLEAARPFVPELDTSDNDIVTYITDDETQQGK